MPLSRSGTKRRRSGSSLVSVRQLPSAIAVPVSKCADVDKENSTGTSAGDGPGRKRACFRKPCAPLQHAVSNVNTYASSHSSKHFNAVATETPRPKSSRRPSRVVVTPPFHLLSSFSRQSALGSSSLLSGSVDHGRAAPDACLELSMSCSIDGVLDSQVFGMVDELEERNQDDSPSHGAARPGPQAGGASKHEFDCSLHDSVVQQLFTPEQAVGQAKQRSATHETSIASSKSVGLAKESAPRQNRLQAGLNSLQSPNLPSASVETRTVALTIDPTTTKSRPGSSSSLSESVRSSASPVSSTAASSNAESAERSLAAWGIPDAVVQQYCESGVSHLFRWQVECILQKDVLAGRNLVYSAPTSGGKSLVAELLLLKRVLETRRRAIMILPFVSIAREKAKHLQKVFGNVGIRVGAFVGSETPRGGFTCVDIAVCTIERANSLVNRLLEEGRVSELCMLVVDELHMLGDSHRGYLLELLLTKVQFVSTSCDPTITGGSAVPAEAAGTSSRSLPAIQIIGMSATLPNLRTMARWLNAELYCTDFRPVPLTQFIKAGSGVYGVDLKQVRAIPGHRFREDDDDMFYLCHESLTAGYGVLVFCPTKAHCEKLALSLAEMASKYCPPPSAEERSSLTAVMDQLRSAPVGLDKVLARVLPYAMAFHHAGLTMEERDILEAGFRQQRLRLLVATSTLASGVNLPARRVIIRTPHFHGRLLDVLAYHQMAGRAGRKGLDARGESFVICKSGEKARVHAVLTSALAPVHSCLAGRADCEEGRVAGMQRALLEIIASHVASSHADVMRYASNTLLAAEESAAASSQGGAGSQSSGRSGTPKRRSSGGRGKRSPARRSSTPSAGAGAMHKAVAAALAFLLEHEFIAVRESSAEPKSSAESGSGCATSTTAAVAENRSYYSTQLGNATLSSALSPGEALEVFAELQRAQRCFVLENELHVVYQVTPIYLQAQWPGLDWYRYLDIWSKLTADLQRVGDLVGVEEAFLVNAVHGGGVGKVKTPRAKRKLLVHRRFYTALALHDLVHEMPLADVASKYSASRGLLQSLQQAAATFAGMVTVFCAGLGWHNLQLLLDQFQSRLVFGVERQLCDLLKIGLLDAATARALYNANLHTLQAVAAADVSAVESILRQCSPFRSSKQDGAGSGGNGGRGGGDGQICGAVKDSATLLAKRRFCRSGVYRDLTDAKAAAIILDEARALVLKSGDAAGSDVGGVPVNAAIASNAVVQAAHVPNLPRPPTVTGGMKQSSPALQAFGVARPTFSDRPGTSGQKQKLVTTASRKSHPSVAASAVSTANRKTSASSSDAEPAPEADAVLSTTPSDGNPVHSRAPETTASSQPWDLVPNDEAALAAVVPDARDLVNDCSAEELEALAEAMEAGAVSADLFSNSKSEQQQYSGFVMASKLLASPALSEKSPAGAGVATSMDSVLAAACGGGDVDPGDSVNGRARRISGGIHSIASFGGSRLVCSTPVKGQRGGVSRHGNRGSGERTNDFSHPFSHSEEAGHVVPGGSSSSKGPCSPLLVSASMAIDTNESLFAQSQDLFNEVDYPAVADTGSGVDCCGGAISVTSRDGPELMRGDSEGFDFDTGSLGQASATGLLPNNEECSTAKARHDQAMGRAMTNHGNDQFTNALPVSCAGERDGSCAPGLENGRGSNGPPIPVQPMEAAEARANGSVCSAADLFEDLSGDDVCDDSLLKDASQALSLTPASEKSYSVIDVCGHRRLVRTFLREWSAQKSFAIALAQRPISQASRTVQLRPSAATGLGNGTGTPSMDAFVTTTAPTLSTSQGTELCGVSVCWQASEIFYISLLDDDSNDAQRPGIGDTVGLVAMEERIRIVEKILCNARRAGTIYAFDIKEACRQLSDSLSLLVDGPACDVRLSAWMMNPDRNQRTFAQLLREEMADCCQHGQDSLYYLATTPNRPPRLAAVATASLVWQLMQHFQPLLVAEELWAPLVEVESRAALCFARMELCGMGADPDECCKQQEVLQMRLTELEEQAFNMAGHSFTLTSPADVSNVLFHELRLPPDPGNSSSSAVTRARSGRGGGGRVRRGQQLQRFSTNKEVLIKLSALHPLPAVLLEWRRINSALSKVVFPLRQELRQHSGLDMARLHCVVQLHTATGRIALSDPNVQNVPKEFSIAVDAGENGLVDQTFVSMIHPTSAESSVVVMRDFFVPSRGHVLLAADYSQLELRLLAHLSKDPKLSTILHDVSGDVFRSMASEWLHIPVNDVSAEQRQQAKQICYGMLYGIGARGLATQLNLDVNDASKFMNSFKQTYVVVAHYMETVVRRCRSHGYVTTIAGRKRYLPGIVSTIPATRSQAERQAVNTTIQGSAADLAKTAMINIDEELARRFGPLFARHHRNACNGNANSRADGGAFLILQLHDELMYEVRHDMLNEVGHLVRQQMENALSLAVPMPVKLKCGSSWGQLKDWSPLS